MKASNIWKTYLIALPGGLLFDFLNIPIPWILGPVVFVVFAKYFTTLESDTVPVAKNIAFVLLGVQIGLTFSAETFRSIGPYLFPYTILTSAMIALSLLAGLYIATFGTVDKTTALVGSSPGGLSAMIAVSESMKGNSALVTIFHTLRLISVLFIIPFYVTHGTFDGSSTVVASVKGGVNQGSYYTLPLYVVAAFIGWKLRDWIPASLVILPMLFIGSLQTSGVPFYPLPDVLFTLAQFLLGTYLGHTVSLREVISAGKTCIAFFVLAVSMIGIGIGMAFVLSWWTTMDVKTAVLALAPGGLVEMAITAEQTGGEPAIVSSLQTIRLLMIVLLLPWLFKKLRT
ncbi:AbrB family transcriptional regulator [Halobacillus litoralis]|uniref:AbrB family transcriptional regulator n=1 Tax=Halobacillus litoralis TaxID=45668 RepID=A0A845DYP3_9BACI|nr:AbrB family transcriptional regulator [Halobacillus litoralis]MYL48537.1 AbrB family transcriptional regulator [Halobacillus litoralis]